MPIISQKRTLKSFEGQLLPLSRWIHGWLSDTRKRQGPRQGSDHAEA